MAKLCKLAIYSCEVWRVSYRQTLLHFQHTSNMPPSWTTPLTLLGCGKPLVLRLEWSWLLTAQFVAYPNTYWRTLIVYFYISPNHLSDSISFLFLSSKMEIFSFPLCPVSAAYTLCLTTTLSYSYSPTSPLSLVVLKIRWKKERKKKNPLTLPSSPFFFWKLAFVELPGAAPVSPTAARVLFIGRGLKPN